MAKHGKKYREAFAKVDREKLYAVDEAITLLKEVSYAKFDATVDLSFRLGINPAKAEQNIRGAVVLPHGLGKEIRVLVFAAGDKELEAKEAGADFVGSDELADKIQEGWLEFDRVISTPDMMRVVGKLGKVLGPRNLMPNPKTGTVTFDVGQAVKEAKAGKVNYRVDKVGNVHAPIGKVSFSPEQLKANALTLIDTILRAKPAAAKGVYMKSIAISSTMSPGLRLDPAAARIEIRDLQ